jgi:hypothetical protein
MQSSSVVHEMRGSKNKHGHRGRVEEEPTRSVLPINLQREEFLSLSMTQMNQEKEHSHLHTPFVTVKTF